MRAAVTLEELGRSVRDALASLARVPFLVAGTQVKVARFTLAAGNNTVQHGLGKPVSGFLVLMNEPPSGGSTGGAAIDVRSNGVSTCVLSATKACVVRLLLW